MSVSTLLSFVFDNQSVRVVFIDGERHWVLADLCAVLDLQNPSEVAKRLIIPAKTINSTDEITSNPNFSALIKGSTLISNEPLGLKKGMLLVAEPGLYEVIFASRKPEAKEFMLWLYNEVLPSIRKHSFYALTVDDKSQVPDVLDKVAETVKQCGIPKFLIRAVVNGMKFESSYK